MNGKELKKEFGDYQTPDFFARTVCNLLHDNLKLNPNVIIEPTSGLGNFISAALTAFPHVRSVYGLEINAGYCEACKKRIDDTRVEIVNDNFFSYEIEKFISNRETLFVGNPPWATNSNLNFNLPHKENFKRLSGTDAITGASNFDICEYIILKLIEKSVNKNVAIAMLCKTSVARNVLLEIDRNSRYIGICSIEWRQGVKHDCADVMELVKKNGNHYLNKKKEEIELEETLVFPLMKGSSFKKPIINSGFSKYVIVTQKKVREETDYIEQLAPKTWKYLCDRKEQFDARKSSIYKGAPAFSMFGVGDYSYAEYKVGISGFYKKPLFSLLYNSLNVSHPIMLDDTSYFLSFDNYEDAYTCMLLLNSSRVQAFLLSISFQDAKRPFTKKVLQRLDLKKCIEEIKFEELAATESDLGLTSYVTEDMYKGFEKYIG